MMTTTTNQDAADRSETPEGGPGLSAEEKAILLRRIGALRNRAEGDTRQLRAMKRRALSFTREMEENQVELELLQRLYRGRGRAPFPGGKRRCPTCGKLVAIRSLPGKSQGRLFRHWDDYGNGWDFPRRPCLDMSKSGPGGTALSE